MRLLVIFNLSLLLLFSCNQHKPYTNWTDHDNFYPVYGFSNNVMGLTIELGYTTEIQNPFVDSIFNKCINDDSFGYVLTQPTVLSCTVIDTFGDFRFYKNEKLNNLLLKNIDETFYVYCTKGVIKRKIKDAVFSIDECKSNIVVFRFDEIDSNKYGNPIFCSKNNIPLTFGKNAQFDTKIEQYFSTLKFDYSDNMKIKTFAFSDTLFFTYSDNFNWNNDSNSDCLFPSRALFIKHTQSDTLHRSWAIGLDLFGIPCD